MDVQVAESLESEEVEAAWRLYVEVFEDLQWTAVQRHLMFRSEFDEVMADRRVLKYRVWDENGDLRGLSTYTNELDAVPLISPQFFARQWPQHFAERRIWYCGFVAVCPGPRSSGAFAQLAEAMYQQAVNQAGVIALDFCRHNDEARRMSELIDVVLHRFSGNVVSTRMDQQSYWSYEFPAGVANGGSQVAAAQPEG